MILKLIIFAAVGIFIYKLLGGELPSLKSAKKKKDNTKEVDTMVECEKCGTYISHTEAIVIKGKFYCDECANA